MLLISNLLYQFELDIKYSTNNKALRVMLRVLATIVIVAGEVLIVCNIVKY